MNDLRKFLEDDSLKEIVGVEALSGIALFLEQANWLKNSPCLLVAPLEDLQKIKKFLQFKKFSFPWYDLPQFPLSSTLFSHNQLIGRRTWQVKAQKGDPALFLASSSALLKKTSLYESFQSIKKGDKIPNLESLGYKSKESLQKQGDFSYRGFLLDIYSPAHSRAVRLELLDDKVESMHLLSQDFKKRESSLDEVFIPYLLEWNLCGEDRKNLCKIIKKEFGSESSPLQEEILRQISRGESASGFEAFLNALDNKSSLDIFDHKTPILLFHKDKIKMEFQADVQKSESLQVFFKQKYLFSPFENLESRNPIDVYQTKLSLKSSTSKTINLSCPIVKPSKNAIDFLENIKASNLIFVSRKQESENKIKQIILEELKNTNEEASEEDLSFFKNKTLVFIHGQLGESFVYKTDTAYLQTEKVFLKEKIEDKSSTFEFFKQKSQALEFSELVKGDLVVHRQHGLAQFEELKSLDLDGKKQDFFILIYQKGDKLLVPAYKAKDIKRYSKRRDQKSIEKFLDKLGDSRKWDNKKSKAKKHIQSIVIELINHYRQRKASHRDAFKKHEDSLNLFAKEFPFQTTPSQQKVIKEILLDMDKNYPMDRLICADVGFGKTEVALRAVFRALENNFQVCFLAPTTVLSLQHYENFKTRFQKWPYNIAILNRFSSDKKRKKILEDVKNGQIDFLIATHSAFSPQLFFKNLGLLIIDEEHRFGVKQKEKLSKVKTNLDILSLSATPIPRTLHMALSGMKDISIIAQPPANRKPVKTFIKSWDQGIDSFIKEACQFEKNRGGQILFVHNRIKTITQRLEHLQSLLPEFKIALIHGGMKSQQIENTILEFFEKKYDVLVSTNIVESGMDIPEANTIFIDKVQDMGLNQVYQLRGRVGRRHTQAYCYLLISDHAKLSPIANERLSLLEKHSDLGSGFRLAMHDLEMRGSGSLFGAEQSGHLHALGEELFYEILNENLEQEKQTFIDPEISIPLSLGISSSYIPDPKMRLLYYKNLSEANKLDQLEEIRQEMLENFGKIDEDLKNLFSVLKLKFICKKQLIKDLKVLKNSCNLTFHEKTTVSSQTVIDLIENHKWEMKTEHSLKAPLDETKDLFDQLEKILYQL